MFLCIALDAVENNLDQSKCHNQKAVKEQFFNSVFVNGFFFQLFILFENEFKIKLYSKRVRKWMEFLTFIYVWVFLKFINLS